MQTISTMQRHASNLFYTVQQKRGVTSKVLITVPKHIHAFLVLFPLVLNIFNSNWGQNPKRALILSHLEIINPSCPNPGQREKVKLYFYFHTSLWCLERFYEGLKGPHETF